MMASETKDENINMPVVFVRNANQQNQRLLIDSTDELFYNPSTKKLHADKTMKISDICENLQISKATLYRYIVL